MATTKSTTQQQGGKQQKTVTVVAYAADQAFKSERAMADALADVDMYARERNVNETTRLVVGDGDDARTEKVWDDEIADVLAAAEIDGDVRVDRERNVTRPRKYDPSRVVRNLRDDLAAACPDNLAAGVSRSIWAYRWQDDERRTLVEIKAGSLDYRRVLAHRSERNGRRKYDTKRKHLSMEFTIDLGPAAPGVIGQWNDAVVETVVTELVDVEWVERIRVADCTETVEREGDCFDV